MYGDVNKYTYTYRYIMYGGQSHMYCYIFSTNHPDGYISTSDASILFHGLTCLDKCVISWDKLTEGRLHHHI
jgi:hypothetical protein